MSAEMVPAFISSGSSRPLTTTSFHPNVAICSSERTPFRQASTSFGVGVT